MGQLIAFQKQPPPWTALMGESRRSTDVRRTSATSLSLAFVEEKLKIDVPRLGFLTVRRSIGIRLAQYPSPLRACMHGDEMHGSTVN
jgi:hypothetical protein